MSNLPSISPHLRRFSSAMKTNLVRVCAAMLGIVLFATMQDMSPAILGAKPPLLLSFSCIAGIPAALVAGLFADSLGCLPFGCSALFFLAVSIPVRIFRKAAIPLTVVSAGAFQMWLSVWTEASSSSMSVCGALLSAAVIAPAMAVFIRFAKRHTGISGMAKESGK